MSVFFILMLVPMMLIGGVDGKFIRILPVTITVCLLTRLVAFLICIPLSRYLLEKESGKKHKLFIDRISARYGSGLVEWLLANPLKNKKRAAGWVGGVFGLFVLSLVAASQLSVLMYPASLSVISWRQLSLPWLWFLRCISCFLLRR